MENIASEIHLEWLEMEQPMPLTLDKEQVHLFFSLNESISFGFGPYSRNLNAEKAFMIYNPEKSLEAELKPNGCSRLVFSVGVEYQQYRILRGNQNHNPIDQRHPHYILGRLASGGHFLGRLLWLHMLYGLLLDQALWLR